MTNEQNVLGRAFLTGHLPDLGREHFTEERHRLIWDAMLSAQSTGPLDLVTVTMRLRDTGHLSDVGSVSYLLSLAEAAP